MAPLSQLPLSTRVNRWMLWIAALGVVVLLPIAFVAALQINSQGDVLDRVDVAVANQQQTGQSTECGREITAATAVAQLRLEKINNLGLAEVTETGEVSAETLMISTVARAQADAAEANHHLINVLCPAVTGEDTDSD